MLLPWSRLGGREAERAVGSIPWRRKGSSKGRRAPAMTIEAGDVYVGAMHDSFPLPSPPVCSQARAEHTHRGDRCLRSGKVVKVL